MPAGRPSKYEDKTPEEWVSLVDKYIKSCVDEDKKVNLPTVQGLAYELGLHKDTINEWCKEHKEFSVAITKIKNKQCKELVNKGLEGSYNPTIAKLLLSANHGMAERTDNKNENENSGESKLTIGWEK